MDFKDLIQQLSEKIEKQQDIIATEEATKNAFIMPVIHALGYDIFDPTEVVPETDCDIVKSKGEKIDYAIFKDGKPIILIECKHNKQNLDLHSTQLQRYFVASNARFGVLTNGIEWRFYTDIEKQNIMDEKPFLVVNMLEVSNEDIEQLKKFHKSYYDETDILSTANELKYTTEIKTIFLNDIKSPASSFVEYFVRQVYSGRVTQSVIEQFTPIIKKSISTVINDVISDRLNSAIKNEELQSESIQGNETTTKDNGIVTTQEELDAFEIIKAILAEKFDVSKLCYKDFKTYFLIYYANEQYWWVCRLSLKQYSKAIIFPDKEHSGNYEKVSITSINDLYNLKGKLWEAMRLQVERKQEWGNYSVPL